MTAPGLGNAGTIPVTRISTSVDAIRPTARANLFARPKRIPPIPAILQPSNLLESPAKIHPQIGAEPHMDRTTSTPSHSATAPGPLTPHDPAFPEAWPPARLAASCHGVSGVPPVPAIRCLGRRYLVHETGHRADRPARDNSPALSRLSRRSAPRAALAGVMDKAELSPYPRNRYCISRLEPRIRAKLVT